jgi:hypothetical protein
MSEGQLGGDEVGGWRRSQVDEAFYSGRDIKFVKQFESIISRKLSVMLIALKGNCMDKGLVRS